MNLKGTLGWKCPLENAHLICHPVNNIFTSFSNKDTVCLNSWRHSVHSFNTGQTGNMSIHWKKQASLTSWEGESSTAISGNPLSKNCVGLVGFEVPEAIQLFWVTQASTFHPETWAALQAKPVITQLTSSSSLGTELPTSTFHQQALWEAQCLMWHNSRKLAVEARNHCSGV